jgi:hypothetical protein
MHLLEATATRWADDAFPGWVEVELTDAAGLAAVLTDKAPVFGLDSSSAGSPFPVPVRIACEVVRRERGRNGREVAIVVLSHGVTDQHGRNEFTVPAGQVSAEDPA